MKLQKSLLSVALLAAFGAPALAYADTPQEQKLAEQASYWQQRGRTDMAASAWRKLLNTNPNHSDALAAMAVQEAQAGNAEVARGYLDRLKQTNPNYPGMARVQQLVTVGKSDNSALREARRLAQSGQNAAAVSKYKEATGGSSKVTGSLGLEYYQTLAGTKDGWDEARIGLEQLVKEDSGNVRNRLALAQLQTYREPTRRAGLKTLEELSSGTAVAAEARTAWRQGLIWLNASRGDAPYFKHYLDGHPDDADIQARLDTLARAGKVAGAAPVSRPRTDMELVAEKVRIRARADEARGDGEAARAKLEEAVFLSPDNPWIRLDLARLYQRQERAAEGRSLMDGLVQSNPTRPEVLYASALYSFEQKRWREGLDTLEAVPHNRRDRDMVQLQRQLWLSAQFERARAYHLQNDDPHTREVLHQIETAAGRDREVELQLIEAYADNGNSEQAIALMRPLLSSKPTVAMRKRYAWLLLKTGQDAELAVQLRQLSQEPLSADDLKEVNTIQVTRAVRQADAARKAGKYPAAYDQLAPVLASNKNDPVVLSALARLYASAGEKQRALDLYAKVIEQTPNDLDAREGYVAVATDLHEFDKAQLVLDDSLKMAPENVKLLLRAGQLAKARGDYSTALQRFREAQALQRQQSGVAGPGLQVADNEEAAAPAVLASGLPSEPLAGRPAERPPVKKSLLAASKGGLDLTGRALKDATPTAQDEISLIESANGTMAGGALAFRLRTGEAGLSQLSDVEVPVEYSTAVGYGGMVALKMTPVFLTAGDLTQGNTPLASRFGSSALSVPLAPTNVAQSATGLALSAAYSNEDLSLQLGTTPLGFVTSTVVGDFKYTHPVGDLKLSMELSRKSVTDSLLSYAGATDPVTGAIWGGVVSSGGSLGVSYQEGDFGAYGDAGVFMLNGTGVANNMEAKFGGGVYWKAINTPNKVFSAGLSINAMSYQNNLRYFTLGHGGYFSPQSYFSVALPVDLSGRDGSFNYRLGGSVGLQYFNETAAPYFPTDAARQLALQNRVAAQPGLALASSYAGQTSTGLGYRLYGMVEDQIMPKLLVGGALALDNARNYTQGAGLLYMRYLFQPQRKSEVPGMNLVLPNYELGMGGL